MRDAGCALLETLAKRRARAHLGGCYHERCARVAKLADARDLKVRSGQSLIRATFKTVRAWRNRQTHRT